MKRLTTKRAKNNIPEMFLLLKNQERTSYCRWIGNMGAKDGYNRKYGFKVFRWNHLR